MQPNLQLLLCAALARAACLPTIDFERREPTTRWLQVHFLTKAYYSKSATESDRELKELMEASYYICQ